MPTIQLLETPFVYVPVAAEIGAGAFETSQVVIYIVWG